MVNAEKEVYAANSQTGTSVSKVDPYVVAVTNVAEGTGHGQRDGESIKLHGFRWNLRFTQQASAVNVNYVKFYLVKFIGPRGATPSLSTFFKPDFDGVYSAQSERNEDWYRSWQVICSGTRKLDPDQNTGQQGHVIAKKYGRFRGRTHQRYGGASAVDLLTDQMYIIYTTSTGSNAAGTGVLVDSLLQISFYDN